MDYTVLMEGIPHAGDLPAGEATLVTQDSRRVAPGAVFACIVGRSSDGHDFAQKALDAGAGLLLTQRQLGLPREVVVEDTRAAYALLCQRFFDNPAGKLTITAVTGTNGKTTVTSVLKQLLAMNGIRCGLIGSIHSEIGEMEIPARFTTPEPWDLAALMDRMVKAGCTHLVMEASSQALEQGRLYGIRFALALFTNLTQDHLDYHHTMEEYFLAKRILFTQSDTMLVNLDDEYGKRLFDEINDIEKQSFSAHDPAADFTAHSIELQSGGVKFGFLGGGLLHPVFFPMPGEYSVYNALAAGGAAMMLGLPGGEAAAALSKVQGVRGRCEVICARPFTVIRDFAHTGDAIRKLLAALRPFAEKRLLVVFGCAGERDDAKRPAMGEAAAEYGDAVWLTSDNPRREPVEETFAGALPPLEASGKPWVAEPDREAAIADALSQLAGGDMLVLCGKGHEDYQVMDGYTLYLDERQFVEEWLQAHHISEASRL